MIWKSVKEEWPYVAGEIWVRWTSDGVSYAEKVMLESDINSLEALGDPEWRPMEAPEWMTDAQKEKFDSLSGSWQNKINQILASE